MHQRLLLGRLYTMSCALGPQSLFKTKDFNSPSTIQYKTFMRIAFAAVLLSLLAGCAWGPKDVIGVSTEADALEIMDVLSKYNIDSTKELGEGEQKIWVIRVSRDTDLALVNQILSDHSLPRPAKPPESTSSIFVPTEQERKQKELLLKKLDIERQLRQLPGVTSADVTIVPGGDPIFKVEPDPAKASVVIRYKDSTPSKDQIQIMVSSSVERLAPAAVAVTLIQLPQREIPPRGGAASKRNNLLLAIGIGLAVLIPFLLLVLFMQNRRRRRPLQHALLPATGETADSGGNALLSENSGNQIGAKPSNFLKEGQESNNVTTTDVTGRSKAAGN